MANAQRYIEDVLGGIDYGTANSISATPGAYTELYAKDIDVDVDQIMHALEIQKSEQNKGPDPSIPGPQGGGIGFKIPWRGGKTTAPAAGRSPVVTLAQYCGFTLRKLDAKADKVTDGGSDYLEVLDADDPGWAIGDFVLVTADESGTPDLQLRYITSVTADYSGSGETRIEVYPDFTTNPVAGDSIHAVDVLVPNSGIVSTFLGLDCYKGEGATNRHKIRALGCAGTFKLNAVKPGEIPWAEFKYMVDNWANSEANRANAADAFADPVVWKSDKHYIDDTVIDLAEFEFDPGIPLIPLPGQDPANSGVAAEGRMAWFHKQAVPSVKFLPYMDDQIFSDWVAGTTRKIFVQSVLDSLQAWGICIPALQFEQVKYGSIGDGLTGLDLTTRVCDPYKDLSIALPQFSIAFSGSGS